MTYRFAEICASITLMLFAALCWVALRNVPADAFMFPGAILVGLFFCSAIMLIRAWTGASQRAMGDALTGWSFAISPSRMAAGFVLFAIYFVVVGLIGFFTSSAVFIVVLAYISQYRNWPVLIASSVGFCIFVYLVFVSLFDRQLPQEWIVALLSNSGI